VIIQRDIELKPFNTLGLSSRADYFTEVGSIDELSEVLSFSRERRLKPIFLGGGSNIVLPAKLDGLLIRMALRGIRCESSGNERRVTVAAGENWDALVRYTLQQGWYGLENLISIPGSAGAAPIQNIGAYGVELSSVLLSVSGWDMHRQATRTLSLNECQLAYRDSVFKGALRDSFIITEICLGLSSVPNPQAHYAGVADNLPAGETLTPELLAATIARIRAEKLPDYVKEPNAGSFFKNPILTASEGEALLSTHPDLAHWSMSDGRIKLAAAWLVDQAGWKGQRSGGVGVHPRQAIVLVNYGGVDGQAILGFAAKIQADVLTRFGVNLEIEPRVY
jgi:UDP-N-acetylmuramate dehydrogenase